MNLYTNEMERVIELQIKPNLKKIYNLKIRGLKDKHIAVALGITTRQFLQAKEEYEELKDVYTDAMTLLCSELREVAIERALGTDGRIDKDGFPVPADAGLALKLLDKLDPQFTDKRDINITFTVEDVVRQLNEKRRLDLESKKEIIDRNEKKGLVIE